MDFGYSIGIGIEDLASSPARNITNALRQIESIFGNLRGAMSGSAQVFSGLRNSMSGVGASANNAGQRVQSLQAELAQMRDFRFTLDVNVEADFVREVEEEIRRLESSITQLEANRVTVQTNTAPLDTLNQRLSGLRTAREVAVNANVNSADLLALDVEISQVEQQLRQLSQPHNINISGSGILNQVANSVRNLGQTIGLETNQARQSTAANQRFIDLLARIPSNANASARSIDRLQAELQQLTTRRNSLDINVNSRDVIRCNAEIRALQGQITRAQGASNGGWFQNMMSGGGALSFLGGNVLFAGVQGAISAVTGGFRGAMDLESTKVSYGTFSQNKATQRAMKSGKPYDEKAVREQALAESNKTIADLNKYADATSFENGDLLKTGAKMSGYMDQKDITKKVKTFGDISGGDVGKLQGLELVYSQIKDAGKMQGQDLGQLINSGAYGIMEELAKVKGIKVNQVRDSMKDGKISFNDVDTALTNMTTKGGTFFGVMDAQSKTVFGKLSTMLGTAKTKMFEFIQGQNFPILNQMIDFGTAIIANIELIGKPIMNLVGAFSPLTNAIGNVFMKLTGGATITESVSKVFSVFGGVIDWIAGGVNVLANVFGWLIENPIAQWIGGLVTGAYLLSGAFAVVNAVMMVNPFFLIVGGIALAISGIKMLWENCETFRNGVTAVWNVVKVAWEGIKNVFVSGVTAISTRLEGFVNFFSGIWDKITSPAKLSFSSILDTVIDVLKGIVKLFTDFNPISLTMKIGEKLREGIMNGLSGIKTEVNVNRKQQEIKQGGGASLIPNNLKGVENNKGFFLAPFPMVKPKNTAPVKPVKAPKIDAPFSGGGKGGKGKDIGDKSGVNKTVEGSKPTVINITFGAVTGVNQLTQTMGDVSSRANEIGDLVVENIIRRISSSVAIAN